MTGWPKLPCRFAEKGCTGVACGIFHVPEGCHCWPDPIQALCLQHANKAESLGPIECVIDFCSVPTSLAGQGTDDETLIIDAFNRGISWWRENTDDSGAQPSYNLQHKAAYDYADKTLSALQSSPQPTAGGDAPNLNKAADALVREAQMIGVLPDETEVALSAERARVIELLQTAHDEFCAVREWAACEKAPLRPQEIASISKRIDELAAALRALGQQDTGGFDG